MPSLAVKYRPKTWEDVSEQSVIVDMLKGLCSEEKLNCRNFLLIGPAGCGKAQPLTSKIMTPYGYITMGGVRLGDEVFTATGEITQVTDIYPQGRRPCYQISLNDGTYINVADNHLNEVYIMKNGRRKNLTLTTTDLKYRIDHGEPIYVDSVMLEWKESPEITPYISPYLFGLLIGGKVGVGGSITFMTDSMELVEECNRCLNPLDLYLTKVTDSVYGFQNVITGDILSKLDYRTPFIKELLELTDSSMFDFGGIDRIPSMYRYCPLIDRQRLLDGLKTSGAITFDDESQMYRFHTSYRRLSDDFADMVRSMGYVDTVEYEDRTYYHSFCEGVNLADSGCTYRHRKIYEVQLQGSWECQCIRVRHDSHTYVSDFMIPTHNTTSARIMANELNKGQGEPIEIDAASHGSVDAIRDIVAQAKTYPIGSEYKIFIIDEVHAVSKQGWSVFLKTLEESPAKTVFILCTTNPENIPDTIISRVQEFQLSKISLSGIEKRLKFVLDSEIAEGRQITYTDDAVNFIAKLAQGGMRDALTLLDKALAYSLDLNADTIAKSLSLPAYDDFFDLLNAYAKKDNVAVTRIVDAVYNSGVNFVKWFQEFHSFVMNIVKYINLQDISKTMIPSTYEHKISVYNAKHTVVCLRLANILVKLNQELKFTQYLQETALTYLCTIPPKEHKS